MSHNPKRAGRPKKKAAPGTTVSLGLRVPAELKARLDKAADAAGRSQGEEAARRLAASFELQPIVEIMTVWDSAGGDRWFERPERAALVFRMVNAYLRTFLSDECRDIINFDETFGTDQPADKVMQSMLKNFAKTGEK